MTDRTTIDRTSHLELEQHEKTFLDSTELIINMGPQHPATHGVLRVILKLDGEKVLGTECVIGYLHRGVEKIAENRTYTMFNPYVDRMDYVAAVSNGLGYCVAVEKLLNVEAPPRAQYIRVILTELNRMASHLLWLGTHALDIGAITPLFYYLPRARRDSQDFRKVLRRPPDHARLPHRRLFLRNLRRLRAARSRSFCECSSPRRWTSTKNCSPPTASGSSAPRTSA